MPGDAAELSRIVQSGTTASCGTSGTNLLRKLMNVKCITIEGENAIISAAEFDWLCRQAKRAEMLERAARDVARWDWSGNDDDCVADIARLRNLVGAT